MSFQSIKKCILNHHQFVSDSNKLSTPVAKLCLHLHSSIRELERQYGLQKPKSALQSLYLENMDEDQVWEQIAANDDQLMDLDSEGNLCMTVSDVKLLAERDSSKHQLLADVQLSPFNIADTGKKQKSESEDEGLHDTSLSHTEEDEDDIDDEDFNDLDSDVNEDEDDEEMENDEDELLSDGSKEDDEVTALVSDSDEEGIENIFNKYNKNNDNSDDEVDDFDELALASGEESESENDIENLRNGKNQIDSDSDNEKTELKKKDTPKKSSKGNLLKKIAVPEFTRTSVDSEFFNVRESEWIADEDILGANNFDDIDFMEDIGDEEEQATYRDFFDDVVSSNTNKKSSSKRKSSKSKGTSSGNADVSGDDKPESWGLQDAEAGSEDTPQTESACVAQQSKSRLEAELEAEAKLRERLEESNIGEQPWALRGEVRAADRPVDSVMTEYLEYKSGDKRRPVIDDTVTRRLEKIALDRFRTKAFDSVERKARLVEDAFEYKKKIVLDQEKSSKSLSKIYEEEYLKKQRSDAVRTAEEEPPEQKQFRKDFEEYEEMTRALSNAHYTPKMLQAEVKIVSNQPALRVEEAMPDVVGDADVLAPQEILAPVRGTLKGDSEKTSTDKKRERRDKKHRQHLKYQQLNRRLDAKVKKAEKDGKKLDVDTSAKVVKRALKIGQVVMMDKQGASVKSSTSFFKQLHEQHSAASSAHAKKRKRENK